jgi:HlyD family secretion protein
MTKGFWLATVAVLVGGLIFGASRLSTAPATAATDIAVVRRRDFTPRVVSTGSIRLEAGARVNVGARVSGVVERLVAYNGMPVRTGDTIAQLDRREFVSRLALADARVTEREATHEQAAAAYDRVQRLFETGGATEEDLITTRTSLQAAEAQLSSARTERDLRAIELDYTTVVAPTSGMVASVSTFEGETVASSFAAPTFVTIIDPTRLECIAIVDETDIGGVRAGQQAEFTVDTYPGRTFPGEVLSIAPDATVLAGVVNYEVRIRIGEGISDLKPEMTANVTILGERTQALTVPSQAVRQGADGTYVWRTTDGEIEHVTVRTGARRLDVTEILSGLTVGDTVFTSGFPDLETTGPRSRMN